MSTANRISIALSGLLFLVAATAPAATLLVEYSDSRATFDHPDLFAWLHAYSPASGEVWWDHTWSYNGVMPADGTTFSADAPTVAAIGTCLAYGDCQIEFVNGENLYQGVTHLEANAIWTWHNEVGIAAIHTFVPQLGPGLSGYQFTDITRTVSNASVSFFDRYYHGQISQTVRIYGVAVPEPSAVWLALVGCVMFIKRGR